MTILNGHYNGTQIVLDEPIPKGIGPNTPVRVLFEGSNGAVARDKFAEHSTPMDNESANSPESVELAIAGEKSASLTLPPEDFSDWENARG